MAVIYLLSAHQTRVVNEPCDSCEMMKLAHAAGICALARARWDTTDVSSWRLCSQPTPIINTVVVLSAPSEIAIVLNKGQVLQMMTESSASAVTRWGNDPPDATRQRGMEGLIVG
jgi:hypothetical protein